MKCKWFWVTGILILFSIMVLANVPNPDTVIYEQERAAETLDPAMVIDTASGEVLDNIYQTLITFDGTSLTRYVPVLSTNVPSVKDGTILDNGMTYVFHIRKGVHFQNGDLLTPYDVVYSLERFVVTGMAGGNSYELTEPLLPKIDGNYVDNISKWAVKLAGAKSWNDLFATSTTTPKNEAYKNALIDTFNLLSKAFEIKGDDVIIHLAHPFSSDLFLNYLAGIDILDAKWASDNDAWSGTADTWWKYYNPQRQADPLYSITNGTGPFELQSWTQGREVVLKRFDGYWGEPAKIKYAVIKTVSEFTTRKLDLMRGDADIISVPPAYIPQVQNIPGVKVSENIPELAQYQLSFAFSVNPHSKYIYSGKLDGNGIPRTSFQTLMLERASNISFRTAHT
ncbi:ABC transporter substrate-binding protein [Athalassotoga sp.]|uniref:ABC transporter substrate-binding protein n=1 Tax=Athalassotoga sp. TaxID=2022597 RepID=UPI003D0468C7